MPLSREEKILEANAVWGALTAELLAKLGVRDVVISPGSRSTPLTLAFAENPRLDCRVVLDERSAAFFALGIAQARQRPVVLVCTSGTAAANYLPAVVEASESGVPLLVLTADRPPELRHRQAGQTIDQVKLFGSFVRFFAEAPVPSGDLGILRAWRDLLGTAVARSRGPLPGPTHLNCPFREPLGPLEEGRTQLVEAVAPLVSEWPEAPHYEPATSILPASLPERGWIVAGAARPSDPEAYVRAVGRLAQHLGWPILADALNPCRHFADLLQLPVLSAYDCLLRSPEITREWRPEAVLQLGPLPTGKTLRRWLSIWQAPTWLVDDAPGSINAAAVPAQSLTVSVENLFVDLSPGARSGSWWHELAALDARARDALDAALEQNDHTEPAVAATLLQCLPPETPLFVASSMPVRDAECFWRPDGEHRRVYFNRGANGIDGTLSTALGVADALRRPSVLYTGDLALLHDSNGMLMANTAFAGSLTIVCVNNGGGGIFHHLPIAGAEGIFEDYFATPQSVDFRLWASTFGVRYRLANNVAELGEWLQDLPGHGVQLIEVRTDRAGDAEFRRELFSAVAEGL